jgi:hypothetical protein
MIGPFPRTLASDKQPPGLQTDCTWQKDAPV